MKTILVVDDMREVRGTVVRALRRAQYVTVEAANGVEALAVIRDHGSVDAVVTDLDMPQMNGYELIDAIDGALPTILYTGNSRAQHKNAYRVVLKGNAEDAVHAVNALFEDQRFDDLVEQSEKMPCDAAKCPDCHPPKEST